MICFSTMSRLRPTTFGIHRPMSRCRRCLVSTCHYPAGHRAVDDHARRFLYRSDEGPHRRRRPWYKIVWVTVRQEHIAAKMFPYSASLMRFERWTRLSQRCLNVSPIELGSCPALSTSASRTIVVKRAAGASRFFFRLSLVHVPLCRRLPPGQSFVNGASGDGRPSRAPASANLCGFCLCTAHWCQTLFC